MPATHETWTVLPHGPLTEIDDGILTVTGQIHMPLVDLERRMTVVGLRDGSSVIYSAIALGEEEMKQVEMLGTPRYLVVPGDAHRLDARIFKQRYPMLRVITPPGSLKRVRNAVEVDATEVDFRDPDVIWQVADGTEGHEAALLVRRAAGATLIVGDLISNLPRKPGFEGWLLQIMGFGGEGPQIPNVEKMLVVKNKAGLRQQFLDWAAVAGLKRIVVCHGRPIEDDPATALRGLASKLN